MQSNIQEFCATDPLYAVVIVVIVDLDSCYESKLEICSAKDREIVIGMVTALEFLQRYTRVTVKLETLHEPRANSQESRLYSNLQHVKLHIIQGIPDFSNN